MVFFTPDKEADIDLELMSRLGLLFEWEYRDTWGSASSVGLVFSVTVEMGMYPGKWGCNQEMAV